MSATDSPRAAVGGSSAGPIPPARPPLEEGGDDGGMTFWEHLDALRATLIRMVVAAVAFALLAFCLKEQLFRLVLWPLHDDFPVYRWVGAEPFQLQLVNTQLTEQFMIHMKVALMAGALVASPYLLYLLFHFVSPALYENERRASVRLAGAAYGVFIVGLVVNYLLIFPLTVRFLGTYRVSEEVVPMLTLSNYVDTLLVMSLAFGLVFELPVISWLLGRFGMLKAEWMSRYRRQAVVVILIVAAIITPTTDILTLSIVAMPIWLLYEVSILLVKATARQEPT